MDKLARCLIKTRQSESVCSDAMIFNPMFGDNDTLRETRKDTSGERGQEAWYCHCAVSDARGWAGPYGCWEWCAVCLASLGVLRGLSSSTTELDLSSRKD